MEADKLKADPQTKVVALGSPGSGVDVTEMNNVASEPLDIYAILFDYVGYYGAGEALIEASCTGWYSLLIS